MKALRIKRDCRLNSSPVMTTQQTTPFLSWRTFLNALHFVLRIFLNPKRLGSTCNFDQGIRLAREGFIALCDQDDRWAPTKLERLSDILIRDPLLGGVFSDAVLIDGDSNPIGISLFAKHRFSAAKQRAFVTNPATILLKHDVVTGSTLMFRAAMRRHFFCNPPHRGFTMVG